MRTTRLLFAGLALLALVLSLVALVGCPQPTDDTGTLGAGMPKRPPKPGAATNEVTPATGTENAPAAQGEKTPPAGDEKTPAANAMAPDAGAAKPGGTGAAPPADGTAMPVPPPPPSGPVTPGTKPG